MDLGGDLGFKRRCRAKLLEWVEVIGKRNCTYWCEGLVYEILALLTDSKLSIKYNQSSSLED